ncbi:MAG: hypothetical protein R3B84_16845 [Zavarzinella sp.]
MRYEVLAASQCSERLWQREDRRIEIPQATFQVVVKRALLAWRLENAIKLVEPFGKSLADRVKLRKLLAKWSREKMKFARRPQHRPNLLRNKKRRDRRLLRIHRSGRRLKASEGIKVEVLAAGSRDQLWRIGECSDPAVDLLKVATKCEKSVRSPHRASDA